jgi:alkanesulfonate monooxygenase SsuD/methylene tetrahydromethanopterin reductase-like flavin-dependent oxidoreductase (luciferase family)
VWIPFTGSRETIERAAAGNFGAAIHHTDRAVIDDMIAHFARSLARHGHRISPQQLCLLADTWVADDAAQAIEQYAPYFLYFNQVLWHHGSSSPGQRLDPAAAGYVAASSYDYVRPENRAKVVLDREKIRKTNRADVESKVKGGELAFGSAKEVTERLIETAEHAGRRCAAAQHQSRRAAARGASRAGAPVRPRGPACPAGASSDARAGGGSLCVIRCGSDAVSFDSPKSSPRGGAGSGLP